ncbi:MAG: HAD family acid phosphatase, partial [Actinomycetota bacterium]
MSRRTWQRRAPRLAVVAVVVGISIVAGAVAFAAGPRSIIDTFTPRSERQITNLDVLRQQIRNYYGDPSGTGVFAADSYYAKEA